ncbi:apoptosis regulator BAX-like protein [Labeo rohita]|nr:apoptosis regulator BAX-like protein [Labeo rohita]
MVDMFAHVADRQNFQMILDNMFADNINWGRILAVICLAGRIAKIHPNSIPSIVSWTQDYFRDNLLKWICSSGGWISSISFLVNYTIEQNFGSSSRLISLSCGVIFISGLLLGGLIIWRLNREELIGEKLLIDMVTGKVKNVTFKVRTAFQALPALPESPLISNSQDQMLVQQLTEIIKVYGDNIDQDEAFNDMIDDLAKVADMSSFLKLVEKVFTNGQITWGRIIVLFYLVGKLSAKMVLVHTHSAIVSAILNTSLDYFRKHLLQWICKMGGWNGSIPALACFSIGMSVKDHIERAGICAPSFPEPQTKIDEREQLVLEQLINFSREIGDILDQDSNFKNMVDGFASVVDPQHFQSLVEKMLVDDITWGKIITLICVIGKTVAKVNSISSLARYSFEREFGSSSSPISLSSGVFFISGALVGGFIIWRLQKGA